MASLRGTPGTGLEAPENGPPVRSTTPWLPGGLTPSMAQILAVGCERGPGRWIDMVAECLLAQSRNLRFERWRKGIWHLSLGARYHLLFMPSTNTLPCPAHALVAPRYPLMLGGNSHPVPLEKKLQMRLQQFETLAGRANGI